MPARPEPEAGLVAFTHVPDGHHRGYNRWHQLDHLPEVHTVPGIVRGERWVATPRCREVALADDPAVDGAQYVTLYLLAGPLPATLDGLGRMSGELDAAGRAFPHRRSTFNGVLPLTTTRVPELAPVRAAAVPFRPSTGVYVVVDDPDGDEPLDLTTIGGVVGSWTFATETDRVTVSWLDGDPVDVSSRVAGIAGDRSLRHAVAYETVVPGAWDWFDAADDA